MVGIFPCCCAMTVCVGLKNRVWRNEEKETRRCLSTASPGSRRDDNIATSLHVTDVTSHPTTTYPHGSHYEHHGRRVPWNLSSRIDDDQGANIDQSSRSEEHVGAGQSRASITTAHLPRRTAASRCLIAGLCKRQRRHFSSII